ncbi:MAG: mycofactocin biosynthesis peptidyl-dipeptidase MftE [Actinomycetota bacterium]
MPVHRFGEWSSPDVEANTVLVIALGATEQHGPHLPLSTDTIVAEALAEHLVDALDGFVLGPTMPIGASGEHAGFKGTLSLGTEVLALVLVEIVRSSRGSASGVFFVVGHGGNEPAVSTAIALSTAEGDHVGAGYAGLPGGDAHAGRTETSLLLHLSPQLVALGKAEQGNTTSLAELLPVLQTSGVKAASPNGILGDPAGASASEGRALFEKMGARLVETAAIWCEGQT